jgi:DNA modification methylase
MDGKLANLVVTDPPYKSTMRLQQANKNDNMADQKFYQFLLEAFTLTGKGDGQDASIYVFHADPKDCNFRKAFLEAGFYLSGTCIWKKQSLVLGRSPIPVAARADPVWLEERANTPGTPTVSSLPSGSLTSPGRILNHSTMKPVPW